MWVGTTEYKGGSICSALSLPKLRPRSSLPSALLVLRPQTHTRIYATGSLPLRPSSHCINNFLGCPAYRQKIIGLSVSTIVCANMQIKSLLLAFPPSTCSIVSVSLENPANTHGFSLPWQESTEELQVQTKPTQLPKEEPPYPTLKKKKKGRVWSSFITSKLPMILFLTSEQASTTSILP